jgi:hypothetical protein
LGVKRISAASKLRVRLWRSDLLKKLRREQIGKNAPG